MAHIRTLIFLTTVVACGGTPKTPANNTVPNPTQRAAGADCPAGQVRVGYDCEQVCQTDSDCPVTAPRCLEVASADERDTNANGTMGAVLEPVFACGIDH